MKFSQRSLCGVISTCIIGFVLALPFSDAFGFNAKKKFKRKCSACHSIGGGIKVGPDLKGITSRRSTEWLTKFIQSSTALIESGDADAVAIYNEFNQMTMADQKFTDDEVKQLLAFIDGGAAASAPVKTIKSADGASSDDIAFGKALFTGTKRFSKGGPQCLACHSAGDTGAMGGGGLGPDLTKIHSKMGDTGVDASLSSISFPSMIGPYKGKELNSEEIYQLRAFLADTAKNSSEDNKSNFALKFAFLGLLGAVLLLVLSHFIWIGRRTKTTRPKF
jgi:cytochrome c2